mmetsp:Transcript_33307/g.88177  ORF Transcript_33307/g.88177 Transcript_33307/m.88177 type:complete len:246 (-) Transcript_33307:216-953(-)
MVGCLAIRISWRQRCGLGRCRPSTIGSTRRREMDSSPNTRREVVYHRRTFVRWASGTPLHSSFSSRTARLRRASMSRTFSAQHFTRSRSFESMRFAISTTCSEAAFSSIHSKSCVFCASLSMWYSSRMSKKRSPWAPTALSSSSMIVWVTSTSDEPSKCTMTALCALSSCVLRSSMKKVLPAPGGDTRRTTQGSGRPRRAQRSLRKSPTMLLLGSWVRKSPGMCCRKKLSNSCGSRQSSTGGTMS